MKTTIKTMLTFLFIGLLAQANSQNETTANLAVMNDKLGTMQNIILEINNSITKDKHKDMDAQIHQLDNVVKDFENGNAKLPKEQSDGITEKISAIKTSANVFEKNVHKSSFFDKDKQLKTNFNELESNVRALQTTFAAVKSTLEANILPANNQAQSTTPPPSTTNSAVGNPTRDAATKNIAQLNTDIKTQLNKIEAAFKAQKFSDVAEHAKNISAICDKMLPMLNDLTEKEKSALTTTINDAKKEADNLNTNALKGKSNHDDIHHHFEKVKTKVNILVAQMEVLK